MGTFKIAAVSMLGALACSPAAATGFTTISQDFYVTYMDHGSTGSGEIFQYDGPLRLYQVTIDWAGSAVTSFYDEFGSDDDTYTQAYDAGVYYVIYGNDRYGNPVDLGNGKGFSGNTQCSTRSCYIDYEASGEDVFKNTSPFLGSDALIVDSLSYVDPNFCCDDWGGSGTELRGTVTYLLGPVPEPATWTMLVGGFGIAGTALRRRHKVAAQFA